MLPILKQTRFLFCLLLLLINFVACKKASDEKALGEILATVGEKVITVDDFIRRSEYTIRPPYARGNHNIQKKIILNSLLAEKMFALELEGRNEGRTDSSLQRYLQGRQEQAMRQWLFFEEGTRRVNLDTAEIKQVYQLAGRTYDIAFLNFTSAAQVAMFESAREENMAFEKIYEKFGGKGDLPQRKIEFQLPEVPAVHNALYRENPGKGSVIGPLPVGKKQYIAMKVNGWTERPAISDQQIQQRWSDVQEKLSQTQALAHYETFTVGIMKSKRIEFMPDAFRKLVNIIGPVYLASRKSAKGAFLKNTLDAREEINPLIEDAGSDLDLISKAALFQIDGNIWTIGMFREALQRHPLVFRKKKFASGEFAEQFRLAIVDLVRDHYLTREAYARGYDQLPAVKQNVAMWKDAMAALQYKYDYLRQALPPEKSDSLQMIPLIETYLNPQVDRLQEKYQDQIEVNVNAFNAIELTRIDMFATQQNVPFPVIVPSFPQLTTDHKLDYGKKMATAK